MKVSLQQITVPNTTTVNVTDVNITSDWQGAILFGGEPTANATTTAHNSFFFGACDSGGRNAGLSSNGNNGTSGAVTGILASNAACLATCTPNGGTGTNLSYNATLSNGVQLVSSGGGSSRLANVLMFAGSDTQFGVAAYHIAAATASQVVTHNLSVVPDIVIVAAGMNATAFGTASATTQFSFGFYDGTNSVGFGGGPVSGANPTNVGAICGASSVGEQVSTTPADVGSWTISAVGASTLTLTRGNTAAACNVIVIAIGHNSGSTAGKLAYTDQTPAATGNNTPLSSLTVQPQVWMNFSTRLTSTAFANNDNAGSWGFAAAVNNNGTTQQASMSASWQYNVSASSVAEAYITNNQASVTLSDAGAVAFESTLNSWNNSGFTENVGTAGAAAWERINLVYGMQVAAGPDTLLGQGWV